MRKDCACIPVGMIFDMDTKVLQAAVSRMCETTLITNSHPLTIRLFQGLVLLPPLRIAHCSEELECHVNNTLFIDGLPISNETRGGGRALIRAQCPSMSE